MFSLDDKLMRASDQLILLLWNKFTLHKATVSALLIFSFISLRLMADAVRNGHPSVWSWIIAAVWVLMGAAEYHQVKNVPTRLYNARVLAKREAASSRFLRGLLFAMIVIGIIADVTPPVDKSAGASVASQVLMFSWLYVSLALLPEKPPVKKKRALRTLVPARVTAS